MTFTNKLKWIRNPDFRVRYHLTHTHTHTHTHIHYQNNAPTCVLFCNQVENLSRHNHRHCRQQTRV